MVNPNRNDFKFLKKFLKKLLEFYNKYSKIESEDKFNLGGMIYAWSKNCK